MQMTKTPIRVAFNVFQLHNRAEMKSDDTIRWYEYAIGQLMASPEGLPDETLTGEITEHRLRIYCASLRDRRYKGKSLSSSTINGHVRSIRAFCSWLFRNGYTNMHLLKDFQPPRVTTHAIEVLSEDEITRLMEAASGTRRDVAIIGLMIDSGLRASEVTGAELENLDIERRVLKVLGKGRRERFVSFGRSTGRYMMAYLLHERPNDSLSNRVFLSSTGGEMNRGTLYQLFVRLRKRSGIVRVHPHLLRHTYATSFLLSGGNAYMLKEALGHTTMEMVTNYLHFAGVQVAEATRSFSPIDRLTAKDRREIAPPRDHQYAATSPGERWISQLGGRR